jgi:hypothetical protein
MGNPHKGNHNRPENGIQKCKKAGLKPPLSCEIQYAIEITYPRGSAASVFFTEDCLTRRDKLPEPQNEAAE